MKIAFFSPLTPKRSGISDYSEELLPHLSRYAGIDLFLDGYKPARKELEKKYTIIDCMKVNVDSLLPHYDMVLYHIGNNLYHEYIYKTLLKHPGIVVLHDFCCHHFLAAMTLDRADTRGYIEEMEYNYGAKGASLAMKVATGEAERPWEPFALELPLNKKIIDNAKGIIVHSDFVYNRIRKENPKVPIVKINHHSTTATAQYEDCNIHKKKLGLPQDKTIISSFGFATPSKRIEVILKAIGEIKKRFPVYYVIAGDSSPYHDLHSTIKKLGLKDDVRITGYLNLDAFLKYMQASDICVQLRFPTQGETSGNACRILGMGKPLIVSNIGWFSELPNDACLKVTADRHEDEFLLKSLTNLIEDESLRKRLGKNARIYAQKNLSLQESSRAYADFIRTLMRKPKEETKEDIISSIAEDLKSIGIRENDKDIIGDVAKETELIINVKKKLPDERIKKNKTGPIEEVEPTSSKKSIYEEIKEKNLSLNSKEAQEARQCLDSLPISLYVDIENKCNLKCPQCFRSSPENIGKKWSSMEFGMFEKIAHELFPTAHRVILSGWGESLMNKHFDEMLKMCIHYKVRPILYTNGVMLNEKNITLLAQSGTFLGISIDGATKESFEKLRFPAKWEKMIESLKMIKKIKEKVKNETFAPYFGVVIQRDNLGELARFIDMSREYGFELIKYSKLSAVYPELEEKVPDPESVNRALVGVLEKATKNRIRLYIPDYGKTSLTDRMKLLWNENQSFSINLDKDNPDRFVKYPNFQSKNCLIPWSETMIRADGEVNPGCCTRFKIGDLNKTSFSEIWNSKKYQELRRTVNSKSPMHFCQHNVCCFRM